MKIVYCPFTDISITSDATQDLWSLMAGANNQIRLLDWEITSADLAAEIVSLTLKRITAVGSVGAAATEVLADENAAAITGSVRTGDTTPGTAGAILQSFQWEQLGPLGKIYVPETRPLIQESQGIALVCNTALTITMSGYVIWGEL